MSPALEIWTESVVEGLAQPEAVVHFGVVEVRDHFAGYFDELGITITVNQQRGNCRRSHTDLSPKLRSRCDQLFRTSA